MRARSKKRERFMRNERVPLVKEMLADNPPCALGMAATRRPDRLSSKGCQRVIVYCRGRADCLHERRKRSAGGSMTSRKNTVPLCSYCNNAIEIDADVARLAHEVGLVVRRGDPEWEELGNDRHA